MQVAEGKRERRERHAETARGAILGAAEEVFATHGFDGARVDDIARAAGYNKALLFHYFADKLGLYQAVMSRTKACLFADLTENLDRLLAEGDDGVTPERMRAFAADTIRRTFDFYAANPRYARILAWEAAEGWQTFATCAPATPSSWSQRVTALIRRGQETGIVRRDLDPEILFTTIMSLPLFHLVSLPRFRLVFPQSDFTSEAALAHARDQLVELVLRGVLAAT